MSNKTIELTNPDGSRNYLITAKIIQTCLAKFLNIIKDIVIYFINNNAYRQRYLDYFF
jgi:hypothetical protein